MLKTALILLSALMGLVLVYLFYPVFVTTENPLLIVNMWNEKALPRNFRMCIDPLPKVENPPSSIGLKELQASASAQFSEQALDAILQKIPIKEVTIIDLRQESHGFINGIAVSWFKERDWGNKGKNLSEILNDENGRLKEVSKLPLTIVYASRKFPIPICVNQVHTESELVTKRNLGYLRIPVTDHLKPTDENVDNFIHFFLSLPKNSLWIHFHCAAGEGRSTTFLAMYDMMKNATKVKLQDIFLRQYLLGGINFLNESSHDWRKNFVEERKLFLRQFYVYCQQNPLFQKSWTQWLTEQNLNKK